MSTKSIPLIGLGIGSLTPTSNEVLAAAINEALTSGYRLFDTAYVYRNEDILGNVLKEWMDDGRLKREDLYIITKLPPIGMEKSRVQHFLKLSLAALQLDYVDLYLIHFPIGCPYDGNDSNVFPVESGRFLTDNTTSLEGVWEGMEDVQRMGLARSIGISNFKQTQIERIIKSATILPNAIQVENHLYFQQKSLRNFCAQYNIQVCAYAPLGSPGRRTLLQKSGIELECPSPLEDPTVLEISRTLGKFPSQILLRMHTQKGVTVIPNSVNPARIRQNIESLEFDLRNEELETISKLDKGENGRMCTMKNFKGFEDHPEFPFK